LKRNGAKMEKANILLVDDQPAKLLSYQTILADLGENLIPVKSGREALQCLLKQDVALILLDVVMPEMDGFETASLIRQHPRLEQTPIIFVTAFSLSDLDRLKGYALGAVDYVFVPVIPEILRAKVSVFVELYRKRQELQNEIEERRQIEKTLSNQTRVLQSILDSMPDAVIVVDAEGKLLLFNPAAEQIHGMGPADANAGETTERYGLFLPNMVTPYPADALLGKRMRADQQPLQEKTKSMSKFLDATIQTVQRISAELRPGMLDDLGLVAAIDWQAKQFGERTGIACEFNPSPENMVLDRERSTAIFRILQESLTNVSRHARATRVKINLRQNEQKAALKVRDNGQGITNGQIADGKSFGLMGMRERVYPWKGKVKIKGIPNKGTIVYVSLPLQTTDTRKLAG